MAYIPKTESERKAVITLVMEGMRRAMMQSHTSQWRGIYDEAEQVVPPVPDPIAERVRQTLTTLVEGERDPDDDYLEQLALACAADLKALLHAEDDEPGV
jgi:hypothetical protein